MRPYFLLVPLAFGIAACEGTDPTVGATLTGAAIGAAVSDNDDRLRGAVIGAGVGAVAGTLIGRTSTPGNCLYRDAAGRQYVARC